MERRNGFELYINYLVASHAKVSVTNLSELVDGAFSHNYLSRCLQQEELDEKEFGGRKTSGKTDRRKRGSIIYRRGNNTKASLTENELISNHYDHTKGRSVINVQLREDIQALEEVVVIGYQTVRKKDLTGAAAVISAEAAERVTAASVAESIQGLAPGVTVRNGGAPGQGAAIEIRGVSSFSNTNPLYVIDGMIADANPTINTNDIESIQILKDASAAAIYGSRAANGVIIITTKQGREGAATVSFSAKYGINLLTFRIKNILEFGKK